MKVRQIRKLIAKNMGIYKIAKLFYISAASIYDIKRNRTWKHAV